MGNWTYSTFIAFSVKNHAPSFACFQLLMS